MPWKGKTRHEALSEFRSGEILEAARGIFASKGFADATVDEIAEAAGVAKGTLYLYFPSKRDVYLQALKGGIVELNRLTAENIGRAAGAAAKIRAFISTRVRYADEHRDFFKIYHHEFANLVHPAAIDKDFRDLCRRQAESLEHIVAEGMKKGEIRPISAASAGFLIYDVTRSLVARRLLGWSHSTVDEDIDSLCNLVWRGIAK
jgi:AcrR family transcriptional regulator